MWRKLHLALRQIRVKPILIRLADQVIEKTGRFLGYKDSDTYVVAPQR